MCQQYFDRVACCATALKQNKQKARRPFYDSAQLAATHEILHRIVARSNELLYKWLISTWPHIHSGPQPVLGHRGGDFSEGAQIF